MIVNVNRKLLFIIITFTLSIIIPSSIYSETYGWFAGFYNYIPSSIVSLLFYILLYIYFMVRKKRVSIIFGFLIACLFGQLFIENMTIYNSLMILIGSIIYFFQHRKLSYYLIVGFMLSCIGAIIMFLNPIYFEIIEGKAAYYLISDKGIHT